jgi:hypothetical protein
MNLKIILFLLLFAWYSLSPEFFFDNILLISLALGGYLLFEFIHELGRKVRALDIMALYAVMSYLVAPSLSYHLVALNWYEGINFMVISPERYFSVAVPGVLALLTGIYFPFKSVEVDHKIYYEKITEYLKDKRQAGIYLFWVGLACSILMPIVPGGVGFVMQLGAYLIFIGGIYLWFSDHEHKFLYITAMWLISIGRAIQGGMFGEVVFWGVFLIMVFLIKYHVPFYKRLLMAVGGFVVLLFIQSIKYEYRLSTWFVEGESSIQNNIETFNALIGDRVDNPELLFGKLMLCGALDRTNQGSLVAMAIRYTPEFEPFAKGETIFLSLAASFVPRFVWQDKPTAGGKENMIRFTGFDPGEITAMDIGQLGDAYVNFGPWGGALFLFLYGLLFSGIYAMLFKVSAGPVPSLFLWIPLFYSGVIHADSSVLVCLNHIIKVAMFCGLVYWGFQRAFKQQL